MPRTTMSGHHPTPGHSARRPPPKPGQATPCLPTPCPCRSEPSRPTRAVPVATPNLPLTAPNHSQNPTSLCYLRIPNKSSPRSFFLLSAKKNQGLPSLSLGSSPPKNPRPTAISLALSPFRLSLFHPPRKSLPLSAESLPKSKISTSLLSFDSCSAPNNPQNSRLSIPRKADHLPSFHRPAAKAFLLSRSLWQIQKKKTPSIFLLLPENRNPIPLCFRFLSQLLLNTRLPFAKILHPQHQNQAPL